MDEQVKEIEATEGNEERALSEKEVFQASCGVDGEGFPVSIVTVEAKKFRIKDDETYEEELMWEKMTEDAVVNINRSMLYTMLDLKFDSPLDADYLSLMGLLNGFNDVENTADGEEYPAIIVTVMPEKLDGEYYISGQYGWWCLMPSKPNAMPDTVRFVFKNELISTYRVNPEVYGDENEDPWAFEENDEEDE